MSRNQIRYSKTQREIAKAKGLGLVGVGWVDPKGRTFEVTGPVGPKALARVRRFMARLCGSDLTR